MEAKTVYLLVEPSIMTPIWHANSIEGLKRAAAKQKRTVCQIRSVEELDGQDSPVAMVLISTNNDWTSAAIESCRKRNIRPIVIGCMPGKFGEDVSGTMYSSKSSVQEMLQYYVSCGRKRVALMGINENSTNDATKREAFLTAARQLGLPATAKDIYCSNKGAVNTLEAFFDNIDQYDGVMCGNDDLASQAFRALAENRLAGKVALVGQDADLLACQRIVEGTQTMTVYKPVELLAEKAAEFACALGYEKMLEEKRVEEADIPEELTSFLAELETLDTIQDGMYEVPCYNLTPIAVTKENMDETIIADDFHTAEDVYLNVTK